MRLAVRPSVAVFAIVLFLPGQLFSYDTPLSPEAIRDAYFLAQHHDKSIADFFTRYNKYLPAPESGPQISSVTFLTPYALVVQNVMQRSTGYSVQQAELDHRDQKETVEIIIQIQLTPSYGPFIIRPAGPGSSSTTGFMLRPYDFWKDFAVQVFNKDKAVKPLSSSGDSVVSCTEPTSACDLSGATLRYEFSADAFPSETAVIHIMPPEGDPVSVEFDLAYLR
jgi:hypothetical protein